MPLEYQFATAREFDADLDEVVVYENNGVVVTAFKVAHPPIEPLAGYSESANLLVMDVMNYKLLELMENTFRVIGDEDLATIMYDIREYHPDVNDVAEMIQNQDVKRLALTHYAPTVPVQSMMKRFYINPIKKDYDGELITGSYGTIIVILLDE